MTLSGIPVKWLLITTIFAWPTKRGIGDASTLKDDESRDLVQICPDPDNEFHKIKFHNDTVCNRTAFNKFKLDLDRPRRIRALQASGAYWKVPAEETIHCPWDPLHSFAETDKTIGLDTVWFVENTASKPVVLSYLNMESGKEVSPIDPRISPPEHDHRAILRPGDWLAVKTYEGHIFQAREMMMNNTAGRILMQHRVGLKPVGKSFHHPIDCPHEDVEDPKLERTEPRENRECHIIDVGFRNTLPCPLNAYFVEPGTKEDGSCSEKFKFHLGVQSIGVADFHNDWASATKFEATFMGHTFSFRLAHDNFTLVEQITLFPTQIHDCASDITDKSAGYLCTTKGNQHGSCIIGEKAFYRQVYDSP